MVVPNVVLMACGSFSPPTPMHFRMFEIARDHFRQMGTHNVIGGIMSPVHDGYKKNGLVPANHRCNMIRLGLQTSDWIRLSDWETRQSDWTRTRISLQYHQNYINSYLNDDLGENEDTIDLQLPQWIPHNLNNAQSTGPVQLKLLCGADILESFSVPNLWDPEDLETILGQHGIVVITRSGSNPEQFIFNSDMLSKYRRNITLITNWVSNEVSSTMARRLIARGQSVKYLLDDRIVEYIRDNGLFAYKSDNKNKYNALQSPGQDGILLKLNSLNNRNGDLSPQTMMAVTPSPDDCLDGRPARDEVEDKRSNVFCCDPINISSAKRLPEGRKSTRRRKGPGQAVQVVFDHPTPPTEVRQDAKKEATRKSFASGCSSHGISIISSAPQLSHAPPPSFTCTASTPPAEKSAPLVNMNNVKLTRHSSLRQPVGVMVGMEDVPGGKRVPEEGNERNYDDMIKFILTEHGIKVISEKECVV